MISQFIQNYIGIIFPSTLVLPLIVALLLVFSKNHKISWIITNISTFILLIFSYLLLIYLNSGNFYYSYTFGNFHALYGIEYKLTHLNIIFLILTTLIAFSVSLYSKDMLQKEVSSKITKYFYPLYMLILAGFIGILLTNDLFNLFVFLEISSLSTYALVAIAKNKHSTVYAFNYLLLGTIASSFYVMGVGLVLINFGNLNLSTLIDIFTLSTADNYKFIAYIFILIALLIKMALIPFGLWLPKTYKTAPTVATAFLSGSATKVMVYVFINLTIIFFNQSYNIHVINFIFLTLSIIAIAAILLGGILATSQKDIKMILAFSSLANIGLIILGIANGNVIAAIYLVVAHSITKVGLFLVVGNMLYLTGKDHLHDLKGIGHKIPFTFFALIFFSVSLSGLPFGAIFFGKLYILKTLFYNNSNILYIIRNITVVIGTILSFYYSWKLIYTIWGPTYYYKFTSTKFKKIPYYMQISIIILIVASIFIMFNPSVIVEQVWNAITVIRNKL